MKTAFAIATIAAIASTVEAQEWTCDEGLAEDVASRCQLMVDFMDALESTEWEDPNCMGAKNDPCDYEDSDSTRNSAWTCPGFSIDCNKRNMLKTLTLSDLYYGQFVTDNAKLKASLTAFLDASEAGTTVTETFELDLSAFDTLLIEATCIPGCTGKCRFGNNPIYQSTATVEERSNFLTNNVFDKGFDQCSGLTTVGYPTRAPTTVSPSMSPTTLAPTNAPTASPVTSAPTDSGATPSPTEAPVTTAPTGSPIVTPPVETKAPTMPEPEVTEAPTASEPEVTAAPTASEPEVTAAPTASEPEVTAAPTVDTDTGDRQDETSAPTTSPSKAPTAVPGSAAGLVPSAAALIAAVALARIQ